MRLIPLAGLDFTGCLLVLGLMMFVFAARAHIEVPPSGDHWSETTYLFFAFVLGAVAVLLGLLSLAPAIAYLLGRGRSIPASR